MKRGFDNTDVAQHGLFAVVMGMMLAAFFATCRCFAAENYYATVQADRWHRDSTWGYFDGDTHALILWPAHPPDGDQPARVRTQVTIDQPVGRADVTIVEHWSGGLRIIGSGSLTNFNDFHYYSRNDIETIGPDAYFLNAVPGKIYMYNSGGFSPVISGKLINQSEIIPDPASGTSGYIYNLFESTNTSIYDLDAGTALYVSMPGGGTLAGSVQVEAGALIRFTNGGISELEASFTGSGQVDLGAISVSGNRVVSIGNPVSIGTKWGSGTISVRGELTGLANLAEGTIIIEGSASGGGIAAVFGTLINHGTITTGYGDWGGIGGVLENYGNFIYAYASREDFWPNFHNHTGGVYKQVDNCQNFFGGFCNGGGIEIWGDGCLPMVTPCPDLNSADNSQSGTGGWIRVMPGASLTAPSIDFAGDTLDNRGTVNCNPFRFVRSDPPQVLTGGGSITSLDISGGNVQFLGPQSVNNLTLTSGKLQLHDSDLNLGSGGLSGANDSNYVVTDGTGKLIRSVGTSFVEFPVGTTTSYNPVTVKTETGTEDFAVNVAEGAIPLTLDSSSAVQRTWRISEGTPGGNGAITFTMQWNSGEEGSAFIRDTAEGWRNTGGPWIMQSGSLVDVTPTGYPAVATIASNSLSSWTVANSHVTASVPFTEGWNIISSPVTRELGTDSVTHLFPTASSNYAYSFEPGSGYQQQFTMPNGKGYWEKFAAPDTAQITGSPRSLDSIDVLEGWNLTGSISYPIDTAAITSEPPGIQASLWYGYNGAYTAASSLLPGQGYWIKASAAGRFIFNGSFDAPSRPAQGERRKQLASKDEFTVAAEAGASLSLHVEAEQTPEGAMSELPPQGPEGTFDVRFASQKSIETAGTSTGKTILLRSASYPLTFKWNLKNDREYTLKDGVTGNLLKPQRISGQGELVITDPEVTRLVLVKEQGVPHEFVLAQNYPNPFNPTTQIKFSVANAGHATVEMFNVLGQKVQTLFNENAEPGRYYNLRVDGANMASGVYFYRLQSGARLDTRKMLLLK